MEHGRKDVACANRRRSGGQVPAAWPGAPRPTLARACPAATAWRCSRRSARRAWPRSRWRARARCRARRASAACAILVDALLTSVLVGESIDMSNSLRYKTHELPILNERFIEANHWYPDSVGLAQLQVRYAVKWGLTPTAMTNPSDWAAIRAELNSDWQAIRASAKFIRKLAEDAVIRHDRFAWGDPRGVDKPIGGQLDWIQFKDLWSEAPFHGGTAGSEAFGALGDPKFVAQFFGAAHNDANVTGPYFDCAGCGG